MKSRAKKMIHSSFTALTPLLHLSSVPHAGSNETVNLSDLSSDEKNLLEMYDTTIHQLSSSIKNSASKTIVPRTALDYYGFDMKNPRDRILYRFVRNARREALNALLLNDKNQLNRNLEDTISQNHALLTANQQQIHRAVDALATILQHDAALIPSKTVETLLQIFFPNSLQEGLDLLHLLSTSVEN